MYDWHTIDVHAAHLRAQMLAEADRQRLLEQARAGPAVGAGAAAFPAATGNLLTAELRYAVYLVGRLLVRLGHGLVSLSRAGVQAA